MGAVLVLRVILVVAVWCFGLGAGGSQAFADGGTVALLPLDAPGKLAIYGQPVAAEIARALKEAGLDVVVVGEQMAVPREAVLIVEGSLVSARKRVKIELRLRALDSRTPLAKVTSPESPLEKLDQAAGAAAATLLPQVRAQLAERSAKPGKLPGPPLEGTAVTPPLVVAPPPVQLPATRPVALLVVSAGAVSPALRPVLIERLMLAGGRGLSPQEWDVRQVTLPELSNASMMGVAATLPSELSLAFDVRELKLEERGVFVGAVRARLVVTKLNKVVFDRTVTTDTVVGARKGTREAMLDLLAREVVTILRPRYARFLPAEMKAPAPAGAVSPASPASATTSRNDAAHAVR